MYQEKRSNRIGTEDFLCPIKPCCLNRAANEQFLSQMTNDNCYDPGILRTAVFPRQEYQRSTKDEKPFRALGVPNF